MTDNTEQDESSWTVRGDRKQQDVIKSSAVGRRDENILS